MCLFACLMSAVREISAGMPGIIQGSAIGPASFVVNSGDLKAITPGNCTCKYADDTYLIIPSANEGSRTAELANVESWSQKNNLVLIRSKSFEIIFTDRRQKHSSQQPSTIPYINRVSSVKILGVVIQKLIRLWSCQQHHNLKRTVRSCAACTPISWRVGRMHPHYLPSGRHRQAHLCVIRIVRLYDCCWSPEAGSSYPSRCSLWAVRPKPVHLERTNRWHWR